MKKVLVFSSSNSSTSINKQLAVYAAKKLNNVKLNIIDLNDFQLPIYSPDLEKEQGIPKNAIRFEQLIAETDGIIISMAEYNGSYTAVFKNTFDWASRIEQKVWKNKPMLLMGTSPGKRGAIGVITAAKTAFPHYGGNIIADFSLPEFNTNFKDGKIVNESLENILNEQILKYQSTL